mmetsp:Transcript_3848/g.6467  ORF Transcript_3848/g.6467 Transcript_3848/m.6467 type:complete len:94 (-) Transcript_3848:85-366(-)
MHLSSMDVQKQHRQQLILIAWPCNNCRKIVPPWPSKRCGSLLRDSYRELVPQVLSVAVHSRKLRDPCAGWDARPLSLAREVFSLGVTAVLRLP